MATSTQINAITALYVGYFDRAPDPAGLQFWIDQIDNGREFNTIAADFAASPEAVALYPYLTTPDVSSPAVFVTNIYANLFGRTPDQEGLDFWTGVLEDGSVSVADMIEAIIMGARDDAAAGTSDKSVLDNKVEVGLDFALEAGNVPGFEFNAAAKAAAVAAVNGVTEDEATVAQAKAATDAYVANGTVPGNVGDTFTLTAAANTTTGGADDVTGTGGNDVFRAVVADSLDSSDQIDGGAGADVINIADGGLLSGAAPIVTNVERINNADFGETLVLADVSGLEQLWSNGAAGTYTYNAAASTTVIGAANAGAKNIAVDYAGSFAGTSDSASFALDDNNGDTVTITSADAANIEVLNVAGMGEAGSSATNPNHVDDDIDLSAFSAAKTINVSGSGDVSVTNTATTVTTYDASAASGATSFTSGALASDFTATGGSGMDTMNFSNALSQGVILGGAGNDTISTGGVDDIVGAGAGVDAIILNVTAGSNDEVHVDGGAGGLDTITNFVSEATTAANSDVISFLDGGAITFANSSDDSDRGDSDLESGDYQAYAALANLEAETDASMVDQKVVNVTGISSEAAVNGLETAVAAEFYLVTQDGGKSSIWYDDDWSDLAGRTEIIEVAGVTNLGQADFDVYA